MLEYLIYQCKYFLAFTAEGIDGKTTKKKKITIRTVDFNTITGSIC